MKVKLFEFFNSLFNLSLILDRTDCTVIQFILFANESTIIIFKVVNLYLMVQSHKLLHQMKLQKTNGKKSMTFMKIG